jgi:tripartite-type tricarboxylate transporter receptor subunit TctC
MRMNRVTNRWLLLATLVAVSAATGCAGNSDGQGGGSGKSGALPANSDGYPNRDITLRLPAPGSQTEALGRSFVEKGMSQLSPVQIRVDPLPNGGTDDSASSVVHDPRVADGLLVTMITNSTVTSTAIGAAPFAFEDMRAVATIASQPLGFAVQADSPWKTLDDLVDAARSDATKIRVGLSGTAGGYIHTAAIQLNKAIDADGDFAIVPHKTSGESTLDLLGGGIDVSIGIASGLTEQAKAGKIRILATMGEKRTADSPDVPTLRESGYDLVVENQMQVVTGGAVPDDKVTWLSKLVTESVGLDSATDALTALGWTPAPQDAKATQAAMKQSFDDARDLGRQLGLIK